MWVGLPKEIRIQPHPCVRVVRVRVRLRLRLGLRVREALKAPGLLRLGLGLEQFFERRSGDRTRVDGVCDFEKVPPDQL